MTYQEFKMIMESNSMDQSWFFSAGVELIEQYPEFADRMVAESLKEVA